MFLRTDHWPLTADHWHRFRPDPTSSNPIPTRPDFGAPDRVSGRSGEPDGYPMRSLLTTNLELALGLVRMRPSVVRTLLLDEQTPWDSLQYPHVHQRQKYGRHGVTIWPIKEFKHHSDALGYECHLYTDHDHWWSKISINHFNVKIEIEEQNSSKNIR